MRDPPQETSSLKISAKLDDRDQTCVLRGGLIEKKTILIQKLNNHWIFTSFKI